MCTRRSPRFRAWHGTRVHPAGETRRMAMAAGRSMVAHVNVFLSGKQVHSEVVRFEQSALEMA